MHSEQRKFFFIIMISLGVCALTLVLYFAGFFTRLEQTAYDTQARLIRLKKPPSDKVAVVLIDEASLQALTPVVGRWPWPRALYADILDFIEMGHPKAVVLDILFSETQTPRGPKGELGRNDSQFARTSAAYGNIFQAMQVLRDSEDEKNKTILNRPLPADFVERFSLPHPKLRHVPTVENNNWYIPYTELYRAAQGVGVVEFSPDADGVYRRTEPLREYQGAYYPVMGLAPLVEGYPVEIGPEAVKIGDRAIPLDRDRQYRINIYGGFNPYSVSGLMTSYRKMQSGDVEDLMVDPEAFKDKIVFVGASAVGVEDLKPTPMSAQTPGVFLHASLASNFIMDDFLTPPNRAHTVAAILFFSVVCTAGAFLLKRFWKKMLLPAACTASWGAFCLFGFSANTLYETVPPLAAILFSSGAAYGYIAATEGREKAKVKKMFSQYVSPDVLDLMMEDFETFVASGAGAKVDITVLFSDIRSFTTFSDKTPPEKVVEMLNTHFGHMTDAIFHSRGTIDKFIGDAIMAFWGAPVKLENHAQSAVEAAMEMTRRVKAVNADLREKGIDFDLKIGIGINSGEAILGNIGSERKLNYTVIGDTVNLASRLEAMNKNYDAPIIISEFTYRMLEPGIPCRVLDTVKVRGKEVPVKIYEPMVVDGDEELQAARALCELTNRAYAHYEKGEYKTARELYNSLGECKLKELYLQKCREALGD